MTLAIETPQRIRRSRARVGILGIGSVTPPALPQADSAGLAESLCCDDDQQRHFLRRVYGQSGVQSRGSVLASADDPKHVAARDFYTPRLRCADRGPSTAARMRVYAAQAPLLAERAALAALHSSDIPPRRITHLICVSCTGFVAPGIDIQLTHRMGLHPDVKRLQIGFMGCHGAFNAIYAARQIATADPLARILICCVELCSLHFAYGFTPDRVIANALFADGAAAAVIGQGDGPCGLEVLDHASLLIPASQEAMTWTVGDHGYEMTLSAQVPALIREHLPEWAGRWLGSRGVKNPSGWAIHPGGPRILSAVAEALNIEESGMAASRAILARHGNMSSPTILFVLQELLRGGEGGPIAAIGFGPGLVAEMMLLKAS